MKLQNYIQILIGTACIGLLSVAQAVVPAPDGAYPNYTTAEGQNALRSLTTGAGNTAIGWFTLFSDTTAGFNTATGAGALALNTESKNTATGALALLLNTTGANNTANGAYALENNTTGSENTAIGQSAGLNIVAGFNNAYLGNYVGLYAVPGDESDTIRIADLSNGNGSGSLQCFIGGIFNNFQPIGGSVVVVTLDLNNDKLGWDVGPAQSFKAPAQRSVPTPYSTESNSKVEKLEAQVAQQQKQIDALTAQIQQIGSR
jgi:hypothetical protein